MKFGVWTFTPMFVVATASVVVFLAALWTAPQVGGAVRPVATGFVVSLLVSVPIHEHGCLRTR